MTDDSLLVKLAEEYITGIRSGKAVDVEGYAARYPRLAERIRELFPTLMMLENAAGTNEAGATKQTGPAPNTILGEYRIVREIGRGGMGIVYEAIRYTTRQRVALKVLTLQMPLDAHKLERFFREARITADLKHPNIVPVYDTGQVGSNAYLAMRYIDGNGLDRILRIMQRRTSEQDPQLNRSSPNEMEFDKNLDPVLEAANRIRAGVPPLTQDYLKWTAKLTIQAASGLAYAHKHKLIHRDIKPSNLILDSKGTLWIVDFGLARRMEDPTLTKTGVLLGTPRYMSPEQAEAHTRQIDQRSDIYSLGATLYELLTCRPVFEGRTPHEILFQILARDPIAPRRLNPSIPVDLEEIVLKAMAKRPEDRYQSASDFAKDLQHWIREEPVYARKRYSVRHTLRWCRRNLRFAAVVVPLVIALIILGGVYYREKVDNQSRIPVTEENQNANLETANLASKDGVETAVSDDMQSQSSISDRSEQSVIQSAAKPDRIQRDNATGITSENITKEPSSEVAQTVIDDSRPSPALLPGKPLNQAELVGMSLPSIRIRIGTMAPKETPWHDALLDLKQEWERISGGRLTIQIFPGSVLGDETKMVEKMKIGTIQAVALSTVGLSRIDKSVNCLQIPMMIRSYEELDYVRERIGQQLEKKMEESGYRLLQWGDAGWVRTFSKDPVRTPDDLRKMKLFTAAGDPVTENLYKDFGFQVYPKAGNELISALKTGAVNAINNVPLLMLTPNAYEYAPYMTDIKWLPLMGGTVIRNEVWEKIPEEYRDDLLKAARMSADKYRDRIRKQGESSIAEMQIRGLKIVELDEATRALWQKEAENAYSKLRGPYATAELFDEVQRLLEEFRQTVKK